MKKRMFEKAGLMIALFALFGMTGCSTLLKSKVNKKFPPVSPYERKVQNLVRSGFELSQVDTASVGLHIPDTRIEHMLLKELKKQRVIQVSGMDSVVLDTSSIRIYLDRQEIELEAKATVYPARTSALKQIKSFQFAITGFVSPYFTSSATALKDTLHFNPNVERVSIANIKTRNFFLGGLSRLATYIVNETAKTFINNINGLIPEAKTEIDFSLIYQKKYSELIGTVDEIKIIRDDDIVINKKFGNKCILIQPSGLTLLSDIKEIVPPARIKKMFTQQENSLSAQAIVNRYQRSKHIQVSGQLSEEDEIKRRTLNLMFEEYKNSFTHVWNQSLDSLQNIDHTRFAAQVAQKFIVAFVNRTFSNPVFAFNISPQPINSTIDKVKIQILEQPQFDCNNIKFSCSTKNCNEVLSNCGSCKWYQADCHVRRAACHLANGVKYGYCTATNAAKLTACGISYAGEKALCFAKYALLMAAHKALTIGSIDGNITGTVRGSGQLGPFGFANDFNSFYLNTSLIKGSGSFNARINYTKSIEETFTSILQCNCLGITGLPIPCTFDFNNLNGDFQFPNAVAGTITRENDPGSRNARIVFKTNEIGIDTRFDPTPFQKMLMNPNYVLSCKMIFGITALWGLAQKIFNFDGNIRTHYETVFKGLYNYKVKSQVFKVDISPVSFYIPNTQETVLLNSSWGNNSLNFKEQ